MVEDLLFMELMPFNGIKMEASNKAETSTPSFQEAWNSTHMLSQLTTKYNQILFDFDHLTAIAMAVNKTHSSYIFLDEI